MNDTDVILMGSDSGPIRLVHPGWGGLIAEGISGPQYFVSRLLAVLRHPTMANTALAVADTTDGPRVLWGTDPGRPHGDCSTQARCHIGVVPDVDSPGWVAIADAVTAFVRRRQQHKGCDFDVERPAGNGTPPQLRKLHVECGGPRLLPICYPAAWAPLGSETLQFGVGTLTVAGRDYVEPRLLTQGNGAYGVSLSKFPYGAARRLGGDEIAATEWYSTPPTHWGEVYDKWPVEGAYHHLDLL